MTSVEMTNRT